MQSLAFGLAPNFGARTPFYNHLANSISHIEKLVYRRAASVARVIARITTDVAIKDLFGNVLRTKAGFLQLLIGGLIRSFAKMAKQADKTLGKHAVQRRDEVVRLNAHVEKATNHVDN